MIKLNGKVYGELIPEDVVLVPDDLPTGKLVVSAGGRTVKSFNPGAKKIIVTNGAGKASSFSYNQPNKIVGINQNGELTLFNRIPTFPPAGRQEIVEAIGNTIASGTLTDTSLTLEGGWWYEVEVLGAGGGGGSGIGRMTAVAPDPATDGGDGGYFKGFIKLFSSLNVRLRPGNIGGFADGMAWALIGGVVTLQYGHTNRGGDGGKTALLDVIDPTLPGDGVAPDNVGNADIINLGGGAANSGEIGGHASILSELLDKTNIIGCGASGGGSNGPFGGAGGSSTFSISGAGYSNCCAGGAGGAGAGLNVGGDGGGTNPSKPESYGGGAGGNGIVKPTNDYIWSGGGGGGGGASILELGDELVICGGGGGGAGAGFGQFNMSTPGGHGANNQNVNVGGGAKGGGGGLSYNLPWLLAGHIVYCQGGSGNPGVIRIWRCL